MAAFYNWYRTLLRHPKYGWLIIIASFVYLFSPIDIAPDLIPVIGQLDDITVMMILASEVTQIVIEHLKSKKSRADIPETTVDVKAEAL
ncbi:YkvA family protein [Parathermosynechococcus lividus]